MSTIPAASTVLELEPVHSLASTSDDQTSSTRKGRKDEIQPTPETRAQVRKQPMKEFKWGVSLKDFLVHFLEFTSAMAMKGDLIRTTLPLTTLPRWLDPLWVDIDNPARLPLCWYGVPFIPKLVYAYAERVGLASYYKVEVDRFLPGDLDQFQTWANMQDWFERESSLKMDLNLVWGEEGRPDHMLTFWSNHEMDNITTKMWDLACDLLDHMDYELEDELMWYLDRGLLVRCLASLFCDCFLTSHDYDSIRYGTIPLFHRFRLKLSSSLSSFVSCRQCCIIATRLFSLHTGGQ